MTETLRRMAEYFEDTNPDLTAEAWAELKQHAKAAVFYAIAGDRHRDDGGFARARRSYLRSGIQYTLAGQTDQSQAMRQNVSDCEGHLRELDQTAAMREQAEATRYAGQAQADAYIDGARISASQSRENFAALAASLREGFITTSKALIGGLSALAQAQREAAIASAEIVFRGLERLAVTQTEGFTQLASAVREGDLLHAICNRARFDAVI